MTTHAVSDPLQTIDAIREFRPDAVVIDLHMDSCKGTDLCAVIRQYDDLVGMPVLFLSGETRWELQRQAMDAGVDDFLVKPVAAKRLVAAIRARVQRLRRLDAFALRDSLTGVFNHATFAERLRAEVTRARRGRTALSVAILDLDHFKTVNDTHGHPAGDRVLHTLAQLLRGSVRESDTVARCGGEEFAVVLPGADAENAATVLDEIRVGFARVVHVSSFGDFRVTLSAGVARLEGNGDAVAVTEAADKALYEAKRGGRNRVVLHQNLPPGSGRPSPFRRRSSSRLAAVRQRTPA
jgi:diguanylate cyclase (GGDEF)-like protein